MFKTDRMMTMLTGLVLAVFAGTMVQYGDRFMALISGENQVQTSDDFYSVRAGSSQVLDILANDEVRGPIVVVNPPRCGEVMLSGAERLQFSSGANCSGEVVFTYCVDSKNGCDANSVTLNIIAISTPANPAAIVANTEIPAESTVPETFPVETDVASGEPDDSEEVDEEAPVVVSLSPEAQPEQAPNIGNIIISVQPPVLVAPSIDEFVTPGAAMASIRQQATVLDNTEANTDTIISAQSSAETVAPVEFGSANFGVPLQSEDSNILLGGATDNVEVVTALVAPALTGAVALEDPLTTQRDRGPFVLAELPSSQSEAFGNFVASDQEGAQIVGSLDLGAFATPENAPATIVAEIQAGQSTLGIEPSGPTALIALQLNDGNLATASIDNSSLPLFAPQADTTLAVTPAAPIALSALVPGENSPVVLEREPIAFTIAPAIADVSALLAVNEFDILMANLFVAPEFIGSDTLSAPNSAGASIARQLTSNTGDLLIETTPIANTPEIDVLVLAALGDLSQFVNPEAGAGLFAPSGITITLPQINKNVPAPIVPEIVQPENQTEVASLGNAENDAPLIPAPIEQFSTCEIFLDPSVRSGANILLFLTAECKPNLPVTIAHAGLEFTILTDQDGTASVMLPALQKVAEITATFDDGSAASTVALVTQIGDVTRAAVTWRGEADLDLHAFEYGAADGSEGHVWAGAPRDFRSARLQGGGYLVELGDKSIFDGALAEVYTMPLGRSVDRGTITMSLEVNNGADVCGSNIIARALRTRPDNDAGARSFRFMVPQCGDGSLAQLSVPGAIDDIRLASQ